MNCHVATVSGKIKARRRDPAPQLSWSDREVTIAPVKRGEYWFGDNRADIRAELLRYSQPSGRPPEHFADAVCTCGGHTFRVNLDDAQGAAVRVCVSCGDEHPIGESAEYLTTAELEECGCPCGHNSFEITAGVSLYDNSEDVYWFYIGCRCPACGLVACYGDWKNEYEDYRELLDRV
jgi:hypothetical protein